MKIILLCGLEDVSSSTYGQEHRLHVVQQIKVSSHSTKTYFLTYLMVSSRVALQVSCRHNGDAWKLICVAHSIKTKRFYWARSLSETISSLLWITLRPRCHTVVIVSFSSVERSSCWNCWQWGLWVVHTNRASEKTHCCCFYHVSLKKHCMVFYHLKPPCFLIKH